MFRETLTELQLRLELRPLEGLLIKQGYSEAEQARRREQSRAGGATETMEFVRDRAGRLYVPGSSVRGVLRSAAERVIGRWRPDLARADDPFDRDNHGRDQQERPPAAVYGVAGPIARCFGHTRLRGRWAVEDAWPARQPAKLPTRHGVGIDRVTGAARDGVKYEYEIVDGAQQQVLTTTLRMVNFELWQLGLLVHLLAMLDAGELRLGYGTRRGLGRVAVRASAMLYSCFVSAHAPAATGAYQLPALAALVAARRWPANGYQCRDEGLAATVQVKKDVASIVPTWSVQLPDAALDSDAYWQAGPWPALGTLFNPAVLESWPAPMAATTEAA